MRSNETLINNNFERKRAFIICCSFLILVTLLASLVVFYISNNIILTKLGYKVIELENYKAELQEENRKLELDVETLSALDRIKKIAYNRLGMVRPKKVEFITLATNPEVDIIENIETISTGLGGEGYYWASVDLEKKDDLILGVLK
ncbi:MAG: cell division protein FtsL [Candidatus Caldatribacteriota bacterium]|nr:cell division protein FtsL [Candidatus Caldatribacteriota bacterium]